MDQDLELEEVALGDKKSSSEDSKYASLDKDLNRLIVDGEYKKVLVLAESFETEDNIEARIMLHFQALAYVYLGSFNKAKTLYLKAMEDFGENIQLVRDLACCYYLLGEIDKWRQTYQQTEKLFKLHGKKLCFASRYTTSITLGKFLEEEGQVHKALELYQSCLHEANLSVSVNEANYLEVQNLCLPQIVRLKAQFNNNDDLGVTYKKLISLHENCTSKDTKFEIEHSLMLAEMSLIGVAHAWARVESSFQKDHIPVIDKKLIFYDFIEELLIRKENPTNIMLSKFMQCTSGEELELDVFEQEIHNLAFEPKIAPDLLNLNQLASRVSWSSYLRLLTLYLAAEGDHFKRFHDEIKNKINLILSSLEGESQKFWLKRIRPFFGDQSHKLNFVPSKRMVTFQNKELDLSKKKGMLLLLEKLAEQRNINVDDTINVMWNSTYSPEYFHRLRMTVHRLNQLLFDLTAIPKIVEVSSEQVSVNPSVTFDKLQ